MDFVITPKLVTRFMGLSIVVLLLLHIPTRLIYILSDYTSPRFDIFHVGMENNLPAYFSALMLLSCGLLLGLIAWRCRHVAKPWFIWAGLGAMFVFFAVDEAVQIHERISSLLRDHVHIPIVSHHPWTLVYGAAAVVVGVVCVPFLLRLPKHTRSMIVLSGAIYVTGAIGFETLESAFMSMENHASWQSPIPTAIVTIEETLEMIGIAVFARTLVKYIGSEFGAIRVVLTSGSAD